MNWRPQLNWTIVSWTAVGTPSIIRHQNGVRLQIESEKSRHPMVILPVLFTGHEYWPKLAEDHREIFALAKGESLYSQLLDSFPRNSGR